jgi:predicted O-methyltransferase YrrM
LTQEQSIDTSSLAQATTRIELWTRFVGGQQIQQMAEVGVFRGAFAEAILNDCPAITRYYLLDPWRHLDDWNKPANADDARFEEYLAETLQRTEAHADKREVLRGRTTEVIDRIPDGSLDFAYVDGDHTLRGITIDLIRIWPKIKPGGFVGGDDFVPSLWQHAERFEPTVVFPWAVYFAEAMGAPAFALPFNQFLLHKVDGPATFTDTTGRYSDLTLRGAIERPTPHKRTQPGKPAKAAPRRRGLFGRG